VKTYQLAMVALADKKGVAPFLTALNGSQLRNRIIMMKRSAANKYATLKKLAVLPLIAVLIMGLANREVKTEVLPGQKDQTSLHSMPQEETTTTGKITQENAGSLSDETISNEDRQNESGSEAKHGAVEITTVKNELSVENQELKKFLISIEYQNNQLILQGLEGCAFKELKFTISENKPVAINHMGMTTARENNSSHNPDFLFEIEKINDQINLTGKAGTAWKKLSYKPLNIKYFITETGVSRANNPLIVVDGIVTGFKSVDHINPADIQSVTILKDAKAAERYGEKGRDGVIEIIIKPVRIYTELQLIKYIASEIKYPLLAQKSNIEKTVNLSVKIDNEGIIDILSDQSSATDFNLDEVVVVGYTMQDSVVTGYPSKNAAEEARKVKEQLLIDEAKRVINKISKLDIEKFKGKTVGVKVKFILQ